MNTRKSRRNRRAERKRTDVNALFSEAVAFQKTGRLEEAARLYRQILKVATDAAPVLSNLGAVLKAQGKPDEAERFLRRAVAAAPGLADARNNLGNVLLDLDRAEDAVSELEAAVRLGAERGDVLNNLASALKAADRFEDARGAAEHGLALDPDNPILANTVGSVYHALGDFERAGDLFARAIELDPKSIEAHRNRGACFHAAAELDRAAEAYRAGLAVQPDDAVTHFNLASTLLLAGEFEAGWREYEWRLRVDDFANPRDIPGVPRWNGEDLQGKTILLRSEQGYGDVIQFVRYAARLSERGARVLIECEAALGRVLATAPGISEVVERAAADVQADFQVPLLSLPGIFGTRTDTIPGGVPYLNTAQAADQRNTEAGDARARVGLVWAGRPTHTNDRARSVSLELLEPLVDLPGIDFVSLQKGARTADIEAAGWSDRIESCDPEISDFADTAAILATLDLLITVDTAPAHLAGAMGRPVWLLLPFVPDWRWRLSGETTPWYPDMRLFRQSSSCKWPEIIERVTAELAAEFPDAGG